MFNPTEIIFAATTACNLHCPHCFVNRLNIKLSADDAVKFLQSAVAFQKTAPECVGKIEKVGFSGGEPFLYLDFMIEVTKAAVQMDLMFDQIMTNGDWWKDEKDLRENLQKLYDAGYDGKIGLSWDIFHGQSKARILTFIKIAQEIFGDDSVNIQTVIPYDDEAENIRKPAKNATEGDHKTETGNAKNATEKACLAESSNPQKPQNIAKEIQADLQALEAEIPVYYLPQTFPCDDKRAWQSRKWFKEDYCEGPGQILYVHPTGDIAPCCGFANENPELFIGNIKDDLSTVLKNAETNPMIKICYEKGLSHHKKFVQKALKKQGKKFLGKCGDICSFCDFVCKEKLF